MYILPATSAASSAAVVAFVPNTGVFRPLFVAALAVVALGVASLIVSGIAALKRGANKA
jgi:hypothetical protein